MLWRSSSFSSSILYRGSTKQQTRDDVRSFVRSVDGIRAAKGKNVAGRMRYFTPRALRERFRLRRESPQTLAFVFHLLWYAPGFRDEFHFDFEFVTPQSNDALSHETLAVVALSPPFSQRNTLANRNATPVRVEERTGRPRPTDYTN